MEIMIPMSGVFQFSASPAVKTTSTDPTPVPTSPPAAAQVQFPATTATDTVTTGTGNTAALNDSGQQQENSVRQAALSFKDVYAVSDTAESVFKDVTGQYITRSVSLRDGTVTYSPTPQYVKPSGSSGVSIEA